MRSINYFRLKIGISLLLLTISFLVYSQRGTIRGTVFDKETGELLPGVTIFAEGTTFGTITDLDGNFNLPVDQGTYRLRISFISYETIVLENVEVPGNDVVVLEGLGLSTANISIDEVVITAQSIRNTENALISLKKNSVNVMDGISSASFKKIGDSDAASSMKRVSGVSVSGGKYVFVRGLGDRYTKTILNGVDIPGLDPDRNTIQMDLFPTNVIDNIIVHKSFSANLPADFTGGVIDIEIKDFPTRKSGSLSLGLGYNPEQHFNSDYITSTGGSLDFLGFDDGIRKIPATNNIPEFASIIGNPDGEAGLRYKEILNDFNPEMATIKKPSLMDMSFSATYGDQIIKEKKTLGYNFAVSYKNNTSFYQNALDSRYGLNANPNIDEMEVREDQSGSYGSNNTFLTGLAGLALKTNYSKVRIYLMHLQNGESNAGIFNFIGSDQGSDFKSLQHTIDYSQRSLSNMLIDGKHLIDDSKWEIEWKLSPSISSINDPDVRFTRYEVNDDGTFRIGTEVGFPERIWRKLFELNMAGVAHFSREYLFLERKSKLKFGMAYTYKYRDYLIQKFLLNVRGGADNTLSLSGDPNELLSNDLKWPYNGNIVYGTTFENDLNKSNHYNANVNYIAGYVSTDLNFTDHIKSEFGLRLEKYEQRYTGQDQLGFNVLQNDIVLSDLDMFPSVNLIFNLFPNVNFRGSYSKTIARPSMKELSYAEIYDPLSGKTFIGGLHADEDRISGITYWSGELTSTSIHNYDLRLERFGQDGKMVSLSGFYKKFLNPIEIVQFATQTGAFQPRNVGDGVVYGTEFEFRQNLGFLSDALSAVSVSSNLTITESYIKMSATEYESRLEHARNGENIENYRDMAGQAPYIINAGLSYNGGKNGFWKNLDAGLYYNVQGSTLQYVGIVDRPDIYSLAFHSLNFNSNMAVGKNDRISIGVKVTNILGEKREMVFKSYQATDQYFEFRDPGTSFSISLGYKFF